ncbi:MAG TPA: acetylornithine/succinylornithine family transaminase [Ignavibacteria bacterium]|nr:acetylornithine/succinylornithine family transaminase [Ignavibacteria bacterium]
MKDIKQLQEKYELAVFPMRNLVIVRGENALLYDENGKEFIDCISGNGVANIGHANQKIAEAIYEQAKKLITCPGIFYNDKKAELLEKLIRVAPDNLKKAFLSNSGTEAVEAALKFTRFVTKKTGFICAAKAFHGRTMGALSAISKKEYREGFDPLVPGFSFVPFNDFEKLEQSVNDDTAGILLEVIQGEGGINIGSKEYFTAVRELCDKRGIILIIDEVQSGFCRTGKMFACEHFDLKPDILCLAKSIAGGIPMGATLCSDKIEIPVGKHGTTFGGNPLACSASIAAIDFMTENNLAEVAKEKGDYFMKKISEVNLKMVREIRQIGLMIGIELRVKPKNYILRLMEEGILVLPGGMTVLRLLPPLTIEYAQIDKVIKKLSVVLNEEL